MQKISAARWRAVRTQPIGDVSPMRELVSAVGRADLDAGALLQGLHDLRHVLVGPELVAGEFENSGDRLDHAARQAERFCFRQKQIEIGRAHV